MDSQPKVVVAEDEPLLRLVLAETLARAGVNVIETVDADQAMALIVADPASISVLFTDIQMPGARIDGLELARRVYARWPHIRVIITSGARAPEPGEMPGAMFLAKPYDTQKLPALVLSHD